MVNVSNPVAALISDLRLEESTKANYTGKIGRIVAYMKHVHPDGIQDNKLAVPMSLGMHYFVVVEVIELC